MDVSEPNSASGNCQFIFFFFLSEAIKYHMGNTFFCVFFKCSQAFLGGCLSPLCFRNVGLIASKEQREKPLAVFGFSPWKVRCEASPGPREPQPGPNACPSSRNRPQSSCAGVNDTHLGIFCQHCSKYAAGWVFLFFVFIISRCI